MALLVIDLCRIAGTRLDQEQATAIDLAARYWSGQAAEADRVACLERLWARDRALQDAGKTLGPEWSINRMVVATLITNTDLDDYAGEFFVDLALKAGLSIPDVEGVLERNIPEMSSPSPVPLGGIRQTPP